MARQYTIGELMAIDATRQQKASSCSVTLKNTYHELKKATILDKFKSFVGGKSIVNQYYVIFEFDVKSDTGHNYTVYIKVNPDFDLTHWTTNTCSIYCSCADFKYRSAYNLNRKNSLFLNDSIKIALGSSLTDAPKSSTATTMLCKHAFAALQWLVNNYISVMKTI